ncbi:hypothetical protein BHM03_00017610 [Ensete ventricosum]|nr:hypothetical protein BHM03_00017610 [Ensete ventricosum]
MIEVSVTLSTSALSTIGSPIVRHSPSRSLVTKQGRTTTADLRNLLLVAEVPLLRAKVLRRPQWALRLPILYLLSISIYRCYLPLFSLATETEHPLPLLPWPWEPSPLLPSRIFILCHGPTKASFGFGSGTLQGHLLSVVSDADLPKSLASFWTSPPMLSLPAVEAQLHDLATQLHPESSSIHTGTIENTPPM